MVPRRDGDTLDAERSSPDEAPVDVDVRILPGVEGDPDGAFDPRHRDGLRGAFWNEHPALGLGEALEPDDDRVIAGGDRTHERHVSLAPPIDVHVGPVSAREYGQLRLGFLSNRGLPPAELGLGRELLEILNSLYGLGLPAILHVRGVVLPVVTERLLEQGPVFDGDTLLLLGPSEKEENLRARQELVRVVERRHGHIVASGGIGLRAERKLSGSIATNADVGDVLEAA